MAYVGETERTVPVVAEVAETDFDPDEELAILFKTVADGASLLDDIKRQIAILRDDTPEDEESLRRHFLLDDGSIELMRTAILPTPYGDSTSDRSLIIRTDGDSLRVKGRDVLFDRHAKFAWNVSQALSPDTPLNATHLLGLGIYPEGDDEARATAASDAISFLRDHFGSTDKNKKTFRRSRDYVVLPTMEEEPEDNPIVIVEDVDTEEPASTAQGVGDIVVRVVGSGEGPGRTGGSYQYHGGELPYQNPAYVPEETTDSRNINTSTVQDMLDLDSPQEALRRERRDSPWMAEANCNNHPPAVFFPSDSVGVELAKKICATCPVIQSCLEHALANRIDHGVWGGTDEKQRRRILKARGTLAGL